MKRIKILLALLLMVLVPFNIVIAEEVTNLNIQIDNSESNRVTVSIPNDEKYDTLKPEISVDTSFSNAKVELDGIEIISTINNGVVTFTIENHNCTYVITSTGSPNPNKYQVPKTCVE